MINFQVVLPKGLVSGPCVCVSAQGNTMPAVANVMRNESLVVIHLSETNGDGAELGASRAGERGRRVITPPWLSDVIKNWVNGRPISPLAIKAHVSARVLRDFCEDRIPVFVSSGFLTRVSAAAGVAELAEEYMAQKAADTDAQ